MFYILLFFFPYMQMLGLNDIFKKCVKLFQEILRAEFMAQMQITDKADISSLPLLRE